MKTRGRRWPEDKAAWPQGPWTTEIDEQLWVDAATGLPCTFRRNVVGAFCGYVGVRPGHTMFGRSYDDAARLGITAHRGLTHAGPGRCLIDDPERLDPVWWFGFDCAQSGDICPLAQHRPLYSIFLDTQGEEGGVYRDRTYVEAECARLAAQLAGIARGPTPHHRESRP